MGIPSYFSYLISNSPRILHKITNSTKLFSHFFLDCNSIIYDSYHKLIDNGMNSNCKKIEKQIIDSTITEIQNYISQIRLKEDGIVFVAFDGVAPMAKMIQQRERRYKSWYQNEICNDGKRVWDTCSITPGTKFMKKLSKDINSHFIDKKNVIVSGSEEVGEGEHKIFEYLRNKKSTDVDAIIYGLDADLIMLSLCNISTCSSIHLFRETPVFIKSFSSIIEPNEKYLLDINLLKEEVDGIMGGPNKHLDYVFLCFMLGNDFLPHFPALNIRTGGIDKLMEAYKETIKKDEYIVTNETDICWDKLAKLVGWLYEREKGWICHEIAGRDKKSKNMVFEDDIQKFISSPMIERELEKQICPFKDGWEKRYYSLLFEKYNIREITERYIEGLSWTLMYYVKGCIDWKWFYPYAYPPLLLNLEHYLSLTSTIKFGGGKPVSQSEQLYFVIPKNSSSLLPQNLHIKALESKKDIYPIVWPFCRYFWESHVIFDHDK